jgi:hypothetical protein
MLLTVDVLGLRGDVFVVDDLKVGVLEVVQMGRPKQIYAKKCLLKEWFLKQNLF